jgi:hypothetical protein
MRTGVQVAGWNEVAAAHEEEEGLLKEGACPKEGAAEPLNDAITPGRCYKTFV